MSAWSEFSQLLVLINFGMNLAQRHKNTRQAEKKALWPCDRNMWSYNRLIARHSERWKYVAWEVFSCISHITNSIIISKNSQIHICSSPPPAPPQKEKLMGFVVQPHLTEDGSEKNPAFPSQLLSEIISLILPHQERACCWTSECKSIHHFRDQRLPASGSTLKAKIVKHGITWSLWSTGEQADCCTVYQLRSSNGLQV